MNSPITMSPSLAPLGLQVERPVRRTGPPPTPSQRVVMDRLAIRFEAGLYLLGSERFFQWADAVNAARQRQRAR